MLKKNLQTQIAVCAAAFGMMLPSGAVSAANSLPVAQQVQQMSDVTLVNGTLTGQFVTSSGVAHIDAIVSIRQAGREIHRCKTNAQGVFVVPGLKNGVYEIATPTTLQTVRTWDAKIAPPGASKVVTLITGDATRGQMGGFNGVNAALIGLGIAATTLGIIAIADQSP